MEKAFEGENAMQWKEQLKKHEGSLTLIVITLVVRIAMLFEHSGSEINSIVGWIYLLTLLAFVLIPAERTIEVIVWVFLAFGIIWLGWVTLGDMVYRFFHLLTYGFSDMGDEPMACFFTALANLILGFEITWELKNKK
ncbi:MAG: hypothetical protein IJ794_16830 [Lachnospiraceae bacterium]|nr:hypothetical protein [Lachnospiraceae bacterium]